jgi:hemerythrin
MPLTSHQHGHLSELIRSAAVLSRSGGTGLGRTVRNFHEALAAHAAPHADLLERSRAILVTLDNAPPARNHGHQIVDAMERILFDHEILEGIGYWDAVGRGGPEPATGWVPELATGLDWVDDQHRHLVAIINELGHATGRPGREARIAELMERLLRHARQHFAEEERWLACRSRMDQDHLAEHASLLEGVESLAMALGRDPGALGRHGLHLHMLAHIRGSDRRDFSPATSR